MKKQKARARGLRANPFPLFPGLSGQIQIIHAVNHCEAFQSAESSCHENEAQL